MLVTFEMMKHTSPQNQDEKAISLFLTPAYCTDFNETVTTAFAAIHDISFAFDMATAEEVRLSMSSDDLESASIFKSGRADFVVFLNDDGDFHCKKLSSPVHIP